MGRTVAFVGVGMGRSSSRPSSGLAAYDTTLLSVHMVQHMLLSMVVPLSLALGAPVTLALRTLPARPRRWLLAALHSRVAKVLSFPPLTFALYVLSPWALYFSGWYDATLHSTYVHELMHVHLVAGRLAVLLAAGGHRPGAGPGRLPVPDAAGRADAAVPRVPRRHDHGPGDAARRRLVPVPPRGPDGLAGCPTRSTTSTSPAASSGRAGDLVGLVFFGVLFAQWVRSSMKEAAREDRRLDLLEARAAAGGPRPSGAVAPDDAPDR